MYVVAFRHKRRGWITRKIYAYEAAALRYKARICRHLAHFELPTDLVRIFGK